MDDYLLPIDPIILIFGFILVLGLLLAKLTQQKENKRFESLPKKVKSLGAMYGKIKTGGCSQSIVNDFYALERKIRSMVESSRDHEVRSFIKELDKMLMVENNFSANLNRESSQSNSVSVADEISQLAKLRDEGKISSEEFKAFSERFKVSTGKKASQIINAIGQLHDQHKEGAISEGNYKASLWTLMDKLDRKV